MEDGEELTGGIAYAAELFLPASAERMATHFVVHPKVFGISCCETQLFVSHWHSWPAVTDSSRAATHVMTYLLTCLCSDAQLHGCRLFWRALRLTQMRRSSA